MPKDKAGVATLPSEKEGATFRKTAEVTAALVRILTR